MQYNTIQYKTYNVPYVTKMLFVGDSLDFSKFSLVVFLHLLYFSRPWP